MSAHPILRRLAFAGCLATLAGCSTPQAALDQANNGAALSMSLQAQLTALRATQANVAKARLDSIREQNAMITRFQTASAFNDRVRTVIGDTAEKQLATDLRMLAESLAKDDKDLAAELAALDASLAGVLDAVPRSDAQLAATEKAMAALGQELRPEQRIRGVAAFAAQLKKTIDSNREKGKAAADGAPVASLQDPPRSNADSK